VLKAVCSGSDRGAAALPQSELHWAVLNAPVVADEEGGGIAVLRAATDEALHL
jgi:hypothetical protein